MIVILMSISQDEDKNETRCNWLTTGECSRPADARQILLRWQESLAPTYSMADR